MYAYDTVRESWSECGGCGAVFCEDCSDGAFHGTGYVSTDSLFRLSELHECPRCDRPILRRAVSEAKPA
jgi:hypothetical protein